MTKPVNRWNIQLSAQGHISITNSDNGRWVEHSDYARLEQERDAIRELLREYREAGRLMCIKDHICPLCTRTDAALAPAQEPESR